MADITLQQKNSVYCKIQCDPSIAHELHDHFCFTAPNAKFHPLYRSKVWDGKIRLFSMFTKEIYVGLSDYVKHFAEVNNYTFENNTTTLSQIYKASYEQVKQFCIDLNLSLPNNEQIRDYQVDAVYESINTGRKLLLSPTGSGKSLIIYCLIRWYLDQGLRQLVVVPTTSLVEQLFSDFQSYSKNNGWKPSYNVHRIYSGHEKSNASMIVISTWQSIYKLPKTYFAGFQVIYGDECHQYKAKSLTGIMEKTINAFVKIGTTGSLDNQHVHKLTLEGLFGPVYRTSTTKKLIEENTLSDLKIYAIVLKYPDSICSDNKKLKYDEEMDFLVKYEPRNKFIRNLALSQTKNTLILFQYVEKHGKVLYDMIKNKAENRKVFFIHGGTETSQREEIRTIVEKEQDAIIIASYGTFSTGINIRNLYNIVTASPTKSRIRILQSIGRGLRKGDENYRCTLYDIGDDMTWKLRKNFTIQHMIERIKLYADEQFDYSLVKVNL